MEVLALRGSELRLTRSSVELPGGRVIDVKIE